MTEAQTNQARTTTVASPDALDLRDPRVAVAVAAAIEKKGLDVVILDIGEVASFADYFMLCSGTSTRHVQAIADEIEKKLGEGRCWPRHIEGYSGGEWVLFDFGDFIVHVFTQDARAFYDLERLWRDANRIAIPSQA